MIDKYLEGLNDPQREAVLHEQSPLMVLAGAGSGKTRMLVSRIAHLISARGAFPTEIAAVTFTNKAAQEMKHRVGAILEGKSLGLTVCTFHALGGIILRREMPEPRNRNFVIFDTDDQLKLIKDVMERLKIDTKTTNPRAIAGAINNLKNEALCPPDVSSKYGVRNPFAQALEGIYRSYEQALVDHNACDFGDMLKLPYEIFKARPDVLEQWRAKFRVLLVDEYQDTNRVQYLLIKQLMEGKEDLTIVGDEDQSIYKWRGADISNILSFQKDFPDTKVVKLEQNYRSTGTIIHAATELISHNRERYDKKLWTENPDGSLIRVIATADERDEARKVVSMIRNKLDQGASLNDFVILYRTNAQSRAFEDVLLREKLRYQVVGGLRFYDRKEIKDMLAYLRFILNPKDSISFQRIVNEPARGVGSTSISKILGEAERTGEDLLTTCRHMVEDSSFSARKKLHGFVGIIDRCLNTLNNPSRKSESVSELFATVSAESGYVQALKLEKTDESEARVQNLEELQNVILEYEESCVDEEPSLAKFLESVTLSSPQDDMTNEYSLKMMTLHMAKGLEFPYVFMVGMEEGLFPSQRSIEEAIDMNCEEERRLCYVGMTRARQELYLTFSICRRIYGQIQYAEQSRFLRELPTDAIENISPFQVPQHVQQVRKMPSASFRDAEPVFDRSSYGGNSLFRPGEKVKHKVYGLGVVRACEGSNEDAKVSVEFSQAGVRKFIAKYADFERVG